MKKWLILSLMLLLPLSFSNVFAQTSDALSTKESLKTEIKKPNGVLHIGGYLTVNALYAGEFVIPIGYYHNTIVNEGETLLRDCFNANAGSACTQIALIKFHGLGTSSTAISETDGGCVTELTTQYNPDNTRATGSQTTNGTNVYRTIGTNTVDAGVTIEEFCLMDTSTGAGNMWTRILTGTVVLASGDGLQTTYDLTIE